MSLLEQELVAGEELTFEGVLQSYDLRCELFTNHPEIDVWGAGLPAHARAFLDGLAQAPEQLTRHTRVNQSYLHLGRRGRTLLPEGYFAVFLDKRPADEVLIEELRMREEIALMRMPKHYYVRRLDGYEPFEWTVICNLEHCPIQHLAVGLNLATHKRRVFVNKEAFELAGELRQDAARWGMHDSFPDLVGTLQKK